MARDLPNAARWIRSLALTALALTGCASDPAAAPSDRRPNEVLAKEWQLYLREEEGWPRAREQWLAGPPAERQLLLDNLLRELLADDAAGRGSGTAYRSQRARRELTWFGSEAVEPLVEGLRGLGARERVDGVVIERIAGALAELRATSELAELSAPQKEGRLALQVRTAALRALATIEDPKVAGVLAARLAEDPEWQVRGVAAELLRRRPNDPAAKPALAAALGDKDGFVRAQAVRSLTENGSTDADSVPLADVLHFLARDPERPVRVSAAEALALYCFVPAVEAGLVVALRDPEPDVVVAAAAALLNAHTRSARNGLVDALARYHVASTRDARAGGVWNELIRVLGANLGARPAGNTPEAWRALVERSQQE